MTVEEPSEVPRADAETVRQILDGIFVEDACGNEAKSARDGRT